MSISTPKRLVWLSAIILAAPLLCLPASVIIYPNGNFSMTVCEVNAPCSTPGTLSAGASIPLMSYSFTYTFANTDMYQVTGTYSASYPVGGGPELNFSAVDTFIGNSTNTASSADSLSVDLLENFASPPDGTYGANATLTQSGVVPGSQVTSQLYVDGVTTGVMGPYTGTGSMSYTSAGASFTNLPATTLFDFDYTFYTAAGTPAAVPEPANAGLLMAGIGIIGVVMFRRRSRLSKRVV